MDRAQRSTDSLHRLRMQPLTSATQLDRALSIAVTMMTILMDMEANCAAFVYPPTTPPASSLHHDGTQLQSLSHFFPCLAAPREFRAAGNLTKSEDQSFSVTSPVIGFPALKSVAVLEPAIQLRPFGLPVLWANGAIHVRKMVKMVPSVNVGSALLITLGFDQ